MWKNLQEPKKVKDWESRRRELLATIFFKIWKTTGFGLQKQLVPTLNTAPSHHSWNFVLSYLSACDLRTRVTTPPLSIDLELKYLWQTSCLLHCLKLVTFWTIVIRSWKSLLCAKKRLEKPLLRTLAGCCHQARSHTERTTPSTLSYSLASHLPTTSTSAPRECG